MAVTEERELRDALEATQQQNKQLRGLLAELEAFDVKGLIARIEALEADNVELRGRLDRADQVRVEWDRRTSQLRWELDAATKEQERLRHLLENERLSKGLGG